jgi:hypothetical protein
VNTAVSRCDPTPKVAFSLADPLLTVTGVPILVFPSLNCTRPSAFAGVIVAVIVTGVFSRTGDVGSVARAVAVVAASEITKVVGAEVDGS